MVKVSKKSIVYWIILVVLGVAINRLISTIAGTFGIPLYLDSIGTMFAAVVGGVCPGMFVGFITNMLGGLSDTSTFYYGTINVLIAGIAAPLHDIGKEMLEGAIKTIGENDYLHMAKDIASYHHE